MKVVKLLNNVFRIEDIITEEQKRDILSEILCLEFINYSGEKDGIESTEIGVNSNFGQKLLKILDPAIKASRAVLCKDLYIMFNEISIMKIEKGQFLANHKDKADFQFVLHLNDISHASGGELICFPQNHEKIIIYPKSRSGILFPSNILHGVQTVLDDITRFSLVLGFKIHAIGK